MIDDRKKKISALEPTSGAQKLLDLGLRKPKYQLNLGFNDTDLG